MKERRITSSNADEELKQLYQTAFPENEQIPWDDLMRLVEEMHLDFTAYYDGDALVGFTIVYPRPSFNWYWYFAVKEELRGKGLGQQILTQLIEKYKGQSCVLDMESPEQNPCPNLEQRQRRRAFYLRNGFRDTHVYRKYDDIEMTIMMMGSGTLASPSSDATQPSSSELGRPSLLPRFTIEDWDEITKELKQHWNWEDKR